MAHDGMMLERHNALVLVSGTAKGRGVFATQAIPAGTIIETCPVLVFPLEQLDILKTTMVNHYSYNWPLKDAKTGKIIVLQALALGLGSILNHARDQNVSFQRDMPREVIVYRTLRDVKAGEELCISYGSHLWFKDTDGENKEDMENDDDHFPLDAIRIDEDW